MQLQQVLALRKCEFCPFSAPTDDIPNPGSERQIYF
jgi:hypothetical protein